MSNKSNGYNSTYSSSKSRASRKSFATPRAEIWRDPEPTGEIFTFQVGEAAMVIVSTFVRIDGTLFAEANFLTAEEQVSGGWRWSRNLRVKGDARPVASLVKKWLADGSPSFPADDEQPDSMKGMF
jgi:hypothetical protein